MRKWIALALGGGGILVMVLALALGLTHANERLTTDPESIAYPDELNFVELENARSWVQTQLITAKCMKEKGFDYTFSPMWAGGVTYSWTETVPEDQWTAASKALDGPKSRFDPSVEYDWSDAGCWGYAVHVMGNDDLR